MDINVVVSIYWLTEWFQSIMGYVETKIVCKYRIAHNDSQL